MINYEDFIGLSEINKWKSIHLNIKIISIETVYRQPNLFRVWYEVKEK